MPSHAEAYRNSAALARSFGDLPTADWLDEQAAWHDAHTDSDADRIRASIARLEARDG